MLVIGDWNADASKTSSWFHRYVAKFCQENGYIWSSGLHLPDNTFTYVSDAWGSTSWLDHCVATKDGNNIITSISVDYDCHLSDHFPLNINVCCDLAPKLEGRCSNRSQKIDWAKASQRDMDSYTTRADVLLRDMQKMHYELVGCTDMNCHNRNHIERIEKYYNDICNCLNTASSDTIGNRSNKNHNKPGWSEHVAELHDIARECLRYWRIHGCPKHGIIFDDMKTSKARFKYAVRYIDRNKDAIVADRMASNLLEQNTNEFWKDVNVKNKCKTPLPQTVEGVTGMEEVAEMWRGHFSAVLNCLNNERVDVASYNLACDTEENCIVSGTEIERCIAKLKNGKSNGMDNVSSEHLKYSSPRLASMLALCFTKMFSHGYLPTHMLSVQLVPIIKSKSGLICSKDNYRPIAIASVLSKVLEMIILERIELFVYTHENQFGFKKQHGTDTCIYVMKEIINRYQRLGSSVYLCFLDASKAFDRINHDTLFKKLVNRNVPAYIVRLLVFWYSHQQMFVKWGNVTSSVFTVSNGVRQGGVLSPYLFNVYMDGLSTTLNTCQSGCYSGVSKVNHLMYADDLVLLSPCTVGLSRLLKCCDDYAVSHDIVYVRDGPKRGRTIDVYGFSSFIIVAERQPYKHTQIQVYNRYYNSDYTPYYQYCILHIPTWGSISHVNGSHIYLCHITCHTSIDINSYYK